MGSFGTHFKIHFPAKNPPEPSENEITIQRKHVTDMKILTKLQQLPVILAIGLMASPAGAQITNNSEFWISTNATGNLLSSGAPGNITSPLDGSSQANFDANMDALPQNSTIHVMAGLYPTHGISLRSGIKVLGSGIDVTILQLPSVAIDNSLVIGSAGQAGISTTNIEISDLTCDGNYTSGTATISGVSLEGTKHAIRRVKVENLARMSTSGSEAWGIIIVNYGLDHSDGNIIEDCEVSGFHNCLPGSNLSAIGFLGSSSTPQPIGIIRDNRVFGDTTNIVFAYISQPGSIVEGNYAHGVTVGVRSEGGQTNVLIINNIFRDCEVGLDYEGVGNQNMTVAFNEMDVTNGPFGLPVAINFGFVAGSQIFTNAVFIGNTFQNLAPGVLSYGFRIENTTGLVLAYNHIDTNLVNLVTNCVNASIDNNYDLTGTYLYSLNIPTLGAVPVTTFGLGLVSSANAGTTLTSLGLPSNPVSVVTNFSTTPVNFNTNVTASGLLTVSNGIASTISNGLPASSVLVQASVVAGPTYRALWTNTTPDNIVVYGQLAISGFGSSTNILASVYYNGSTIPICTNLPYGVPMPTLLLKPQSILAITNNVSSVNFGVQLHWYPF
jgi:hypothetical protein